jgi:hypothetical protein
MILTLFGFPHVHVGLWKRHPCEKPVLAGAHFYTFTRSCEVLLPTLINDLLQAHQWPHISCLATWREPGPFTALRVAQALAQGLAVGWGNLPIFMPSFFEASHLNRMELAVHTGGFSWILKDFSRVETPPQDHGLISSQHCTEQDTQLLAQALAQYTAQDPISSLG